MAVKHLLISDNSDKEMPQTIVYFFSPD